MKAGYSVVTTADVALVGRTLAHGVTAASNWTTEPTAITVLEEHRLTPMGGTEFIYLPLDQSYDCALGEGFAIRLTAPTSAVNARATMKWERC
jgi:hypothetical protein